MRVAPYYRVSRKDQERGISIDIQRDYCQRIASSHGWMLTEPYIDDGKSAFTEDLVKRPAFQRLMATLKWSLKWC